MKKKRNGKLYIRGEPNCYTVKRKQFCRPFRYFIYNVPRESVCVCVYEGEREREGERVRESEGRRERERYLQVGT